MHNADSNVCIYAVIANSPYIIYKITYSFGKVSGIAKDMHQSSSVYIMSVL